MSQNDIPSSHTQHAFLVAWGRFAQEIGLIERLQTVTIGVPETKEVRAYASSLPRC